MKISTVALLSTFALVGLAGRSADAENTAFVRGYAYDCAAERPLGGVTVAFHSGSDSRTVKTTSDGKFTVFGLSQGTYSVELKADVLVEPRFVRSTSPFPMRPREAPSPMRSREAQMVHLTTTRTLSVVPNDLVSMRIGVGAVNDVNDAFGRVVPLKCDPDVIAVTPGPIERTTVISH